MCLICKGVPGNSDNLPHLVGDGMSGLSPGSQREGVGFAPGDCESCMGGQPQWEALPSLHLTSGLEVAPFLLSRLGFPSNWGLPISHFPLGPQCWEKATQRAGLRLPLVRPVPCLRDPG